MPLSGTTTAYGPYGTVNIEYILLQIYNVFTGASIEKESALEFAETFWFWFQLVSYSISVLLIVGIIYSVIKIRDIRIAEAEEFKKPPQQLATPAERKNEKWIRVEELSQSENPNDWRLAILEADILLEEMVTVMGYKGDTLGDKMKHIEASDFNTLGQAWEAHKVRNLIAHVGSDFILTRRETLRVIDLYRQVLEEFQFL